MIFRSWLTPDSFRHHHYHHFFNIPPSKFWGGQNANWVENERFVGQIEAIYGKRYSFKFSSKAFLLVSFRLPATLFAPILLLSF